jgi:hypothetical protein
MKAWRFLTLMLTALSMGMAFCHLLEMPAKLAYQGPLWLMLQQTLYGTFGTLGALLEVGAVVCSFVLTFLVRARHPALGWTLVGAICLVGAQVAWWAGVAPVNAEIDGLTAETLPVHWTQLRAQWEYTHALRAGLQMAALGAIVCSVLVETPQRLS